MYFEGHLSSFLRFVENEQDIEDVAAYFNSLRTRSQRVDSPLENNIVSKNESFEALSHVFENVDKSTTHSDVSVTNGFAIELHLHSHTSSLIHRACMKNRYFGRYD